MSIDKLVNKPPTYKAKPKEKKHAFIAARTNYTAQNMTKENEAKTPSLFHHHGHKQLQGQS